MQKKKFNWLDARGYYANSVVFSSEVRNNNNTGPSDKVEQGDNL